MDRPAMSYWPSMEQSIRTRGVRLPSQCEVSSLITLQRIPYTRLFVGICMYILTTNVEQKKSYTFNNDSNEFSKSLIKKHVRGLQDSIKTNN